MKKNILKFLILIGIITIIPQCKKDTLVEKEKCMYLGQFSITENELSYVPYSVNDTLEFIDNSGNSRKFWISQFEKSLQVRYEDPADYNSNYYYVENISIEFNDAFGTQNIQMRTQMEKERTLMTLYFSPPNLTASDSSYKAFFAYMDGEKFSTSTDIYHPSISILNKTFYTVYELENNFQPYPTIDNLQYIYFAKHIGIAGFKTTNGTSWVLNN